MSAMDIDDPRDVNGDDDMETVNGIMDGKALDKQKEKMNGVDDGMISPESLEAP
jgi:hypothetical protein